MVPEESKDITFTDKVAKKVLDELSQRENYKKWNKKSPIPIKLSDDKSKKGYAVIFVLRTNGSIDIEKQPIIDGMVKLKGNDTFHRAEADFIWRYKKYPVIFQPEFSSEPISPYSLAKETRDEGKGTDSQRFITKAIEMSNLNPPKKAGMGGKIFVYGIIGIAVLYIIIQFITKGHL